MEALPNLVTHFEFPRYKAEDINQFSRQFLPGDFKGMVKAILETEAPLSEELLLKRIVSLFGREKVTSVVQRTYEQQMYARITSTLMARCFR